ncbi:MAG: GMC family oxidoreductase [Alcanivoracaceae bacterium]|nr:GMC family oxidoreductase [Alcanivoracaceae bacterium]
MGNSIRHFDVIVIGSGFGGSVMTCRLAEKGYKVCLLERGKKYGFGEFPRRVDEVKNKMPWDPDNNKFGYIEMRYYPGSDAGSVSAAGLGGGSLIYANVLYKVPTDFFQGWPGGINRTLLDPYYDKAMNMLEGAQYPIDNPYYSDNPKAELMKQAFEKLENAEDSLRDAKFWYPPTAVRFKGDFPGHQTLNNQGVIQSSCNKCGECDVGCNIHAKNTTDLNYLARATNEKLLGDGCTAAEIRTHAWVQTIKQMDNQQFEVTYCNPKNQNETTIITADKVVLSAGSIGSSGLLLQMKKHGHLANISDKLGHYWSGNGDLEGTVILPEPNGHPSKGPTIATTTDYRFKDYPDGFAHGMLIQEGGFPTFMGWFLAGKSPSPGVIWHGLKMATTGIKNAILRLFGNKKASLLDLNIGHEILSFIDSDRFVRRTLMLLGMGRDRNTGVVYLREDDTVMIKWDMQPSQLHFDRMRREMGKIAKALDGKYLDSPLTYAGKMIAVHPLGGCVMADNAENGVVACNGEVFGHPGLYVADGSVIPTSLGPNPSLTISAISEYFASQFADKRP